MNFHDGSETMSNFYNSYSQFLKEKFNANVYKISLTSNGTCPNRDGTLGTGGCIYCSNSGSGRIYTKPAYEQVKDFIECRNGNKIRYIAYFQSFSNMYKNRESIIESMERISKFSQIVGFSIATRPDTIDENILNYLKSISKRYFIQIEMGLETANNFTLEKINRKIKAEKYISAAKNIRKIIPECHIVCHVILGLLEEQFDDFDNTIEFYLRSESDGIKFHHLYVHKNTKLNEMFNEGKARVMGEWEYIESVMKLLEKIPPEKVIHRIKSSMVPQYLVAPLWTMDRNFYEKLFTYAKRYKSYQGKMYGNNNFNCW